MLRDDDRQGGELPLLGIGVDLIGDDHVLSLWPVQALRESRADAVDVRAGSLSALGGRPSVDVPAEPRLVHPVHDRGYPRHGGRAVGTRSVAGGHARRDVDAAPAVRLPFRVQVAVASPAFAESGARDGLVIPTDKAVVGAGDEV